MGRPRNIEHLLRMWNLEDYKNQLLQRLNESNFETQRYLGRGGKAYVFWLSDQKKIFKVTIDDRDALACAALSSRPDKNLLHVYDVFQFGNTEFHGIVAEKLTPLSSSEHKEWQEISDVITESAELYDLPYWQGLTAKWIQESKEALPDVAEMAGQAFAATFHAYLYQMEIWQKALQERGITWTDLTADNIMHRGRQLLISDVGRSRVKDHPRIPKL